VESKSIQGVGLIKLQFHPGTNMAQAVAETVSYVDRARAFMPTGTLPPFVMRFDGGSVPVGDLVFSSTTKTVADAAPIHGDAVHSRRVHPRLLHDGRST
jgi:multidrug efflux pump subunit AcrB